MSFISFIAPFSVFILQFVISFTCFYYLQMGNARVPIPAQRPNGTTATSAPTPSTSTVSFQFVHFVIVPYAVFSLLNMRFESCFYLRQATPHSQSQTVVVHNPKTVDRSGKLVKQFLIPSFFPSPFNMVVKCTLQWL